MLIVIYGHVTVFLQNKQKDTITMFRQNKYNLLISTSVAEEGLDIPECNMVVRYGLLTNEIAQQQARGRARAEDSIYSVVATAGSREVRREKTNEYLEELTGEAVTRVQRMERDDRRTYQRRVSSHLFMGSCKNIIISAQNCKHLLNVTF